FNQPAFTKARAGYRGCRPRYHTAKDDLENIDLRSVQHLGMSTLAVVRDWGNADLRKIPLLPDSVFFVIPGRILSYPVTFVRPLGVLLVIIFTILLLVGFRRARLSLRGVGMGVLLWLASTLVCVALGASAWWTLKSLKLVNSSYSSAYNAGTYAIAFVVLTIASTTALHSLCRRTVEAEDLAVGGLFWYLILTVVTSWYVPG